MFPFPSLLYLSWRGVCGRRDGMGKEEWMKHMYCSNDWKGRLKSKAFFGVPSFRIFFLSLFVFLFVNDDGLGLWAGWWLVMVFLSTFSYVVKSLSLLLTCFPLYFSLVSLPSSSYSIPWGGGILLGHVRQGVKDLRPSSTHAKWPFLFLPIPVWFLILSLVFSSLKVRCYFFFYLLPLSLFVSYVLFLLFPRSLSRTRIGFSKTQNAREVCG